MSLRILRLFGLISLLPLSALAQTVTYTFTGVMDESIFHPHPDNDSVIYPAGTSFSGSATYEVGADVVTSDSISTTYEGSTFSVTFETFTLTAGSPTFTVSNSDSGSDALAIYEDNFFPATLNGTPIGIREVGIGLYDSTDALVSGTSLPGSAFPVGAFDSLEFTIWVVDSTNTFTGATYEGTITSLNNVSAVPEPGTAAALMGAVVGVWAIGRRRPTATTKTPAA